MADLKEGVEKSDYVIYGDILFASFEKEAISFSKKLDKKA